MSVVLNGQSVKKKKKKNNNVGLIVVSVMAALIIAVLVFNALVLSKADEVLADTEKYESEIPQRDILQPIPTLEETTMNVTETEMFIEEVTEEIYSEPDIYSMDVFDLGAYLYGISYDDTYASLVLITYEAYGYSPLSYYVACCCWVRATEDYWGYGDLYSAFGEADTSYGPWMAELGYEDWAIDALWECYMDPTYACYCNGMTVPSDYIYYEDGIYVWR